MQRGTQTTESELEHMWSEKYKIHADNEDSEMNDPISLDNLTET